MGVSIATICPFKKWCNNDFMALECSRQTDHKCSLSCISFGLVYNALFAILNLCLFYLKTWLCKPFSYHPFFLSSKVIPFQNVGFLLLEDLDDRNAVYWLLRLIFVYLKCLLVGRRLEVCLRLESNRG